MVVLFDLLQSVLHSKSESQRKEKMGASDSETHENHHPYAPQSVKLPGFVPGFLSQSTILGVYGISSLLVVFITWLISGTPSLLHLSDPTLFNFIRQTL